MIQRHAVVQRRSVGFLLAVLLLSAGCDGITGPSASEATWTTVALDERVVDAYTGFGFELFRHLRDMDPDENLFMSPTSAALALAMTYNGAVGQTEFEMARALGIEHLDRETVNETNRIWLETLAATGDPSVELALANSIWHREPIRDSFRDRVQAYYSAEIHPITTAEVINAWVEAETRGLIDEIIEGEIPLNVVAYLINALYFKADWTYPFDVAETHEAPFHRLDGSTAPVPMMFQEGSFDIRSDGEMQMLRLPYGAGRFSMILALPRPGHDLGTIVQRLDVDRWREWMDGFREAPKVEVRLPRFEVEWDTTLVAPLKAMGMEVPFTPGAADFSDMFPAPGPWIGEVLQKTFLRVDEKGTEAAAVTKVVLVRSATPRITFDRPFILAIWDHATETILFLGQITDPAA